VDGLEQQYGRQLQFLRIDFNSPTGRGLAPRYGVHAHPTIVLVDRTGTVRTTIVGVPVPEKVEQAITDVLR
jgi:thioredoxin-related protein